MARFIIIILTIGFWALFFNGSENNTIQLLNDYVYLKYPSENMNTYIYVGIKRQKLYLIQNGKLIHEFEVSTAKNGAGCEKGSQKTPIGLHEIRRKIGDNVPLAGQFNFKKHNGEIADINLSDSPTEEDYILTRILTLRGLEEGINKGEGIDSYERAIYIHGTADEGLIGKPASHGCVRMKNEEIIKLYDLIEENTKVVMFNN